MLPIYICIVIRIFLFTKKSKYSAGHVLLVNYHLDFCIYHIFPNPSDRRTTRCFCITGIFTDISNVAIICQFIGRTPCVLLPSHPVTSQWWKTPGWCLPSSSKSLPSSWWYLSSSWWYLPSSSCISKLMTFLESVQDFPSWWRYQFRLVMMMTTLPLYDNDDDNVDVEGPFKVRPPPLPSGHLWIGFQLVQLGNV